VREKGIDCFAQTIGELRRRGRRVRPLVVGAGPAEAEFRRKVGDAHFTGHLEGQELGRAIASADVLLNPSVTEAFGNVNLEAMAAGLVVVSADAGSARAIISNGVDGLYCYPDPNELADCIEEVLDNPSRARGLREAAARTASVKRWEDVLEPVVQAYCYGQRAHVDVRAKAKNDDREELRADAAVARSPVG
jgi:glycosyltransferase involved in cell wall biosynthesis